VRPSDLDKFSAIPRDEDGPVIREPWEAQAFGMTLVLHERRPFTWREWADSLTAELTAAKARGEEDDGSRYYLYWLTALGKLVAEKRLVPAEDLALRKQQWDAAALDAARPTDRAATPLTSGRCATTSRRLAVDTRARPRRGQWLPRARRCANADRRIRLSPRSGRAQGRSAPDGGVHDPGAHHSRRGHLPSLVAVCSSTRRSPTRRRSLKMRPPTTPRRTPRLRCASNSCRQCVS
jgi:nitrile hydratase accessory protein